jgi:alkylhydroperoxidase family enzyme
VRGVLEGLPHIDFEDLDEGLKERLAPRVERLGYLGEFFQVAAQQPEALGRFIDFTEALKEALPTRLTEVIALTVSSRTQNIYERVQHEHLARKVGFTTAEIEALERGSVTVTDGFTEVECAVADLAQAIVAAGGKGCPNAYRRVRELAGDKAAAGLMMMGARYLAHASISNTWRLEAPVVSIFDRSEKVGEL